MIPSLYEPFRHWSEKGSVYILSDLHLGDWDCSLMSPGWITPEEQIKILKQHIHKHDTFVCLGDVGDVSYLKDLPGYKVLLLGNHDETATKFRKVFGEIYEGPLIINEKLILSHEPVYVPWAFNIHGHDHNDNKGDETHLNLAANVCGYTPVSLGELIKSGILRRVSSIHRITIDKAVENKRKESN